MNGMTNTQLRRCELITEQEVVDLCAKAKEILMKEENIREVRTPVTVGVLSYA